VTVRPPTVRRRTVRRRTVRPRTVREVVVVHDTGCGGCSRVAADLATLLRVPVRARSCRDPDVFTAYPELPAPVRACRAPAVGTVDVDGRVRWRLGLRSAPALLALVRPRTLPRALAVLVTAGRTARARRAARG
jgi:hypothetical protein